jgi:acyl-CoA synthetase (NDP forming)
LAEDKDLRVIAVYIEGFKILDGLRFIEAARRLRDQGRTVVLYRAGRSEAGALAAASHTASLSGSYATTIALARAAGVLIAESLADFEDLLELAARFSERPLAGRSLAGVSNAGFECVALSDHLGWWTPAELTQRTVSELRELLHRAGVDGLVEVRNPLDVTPMMGDEIYARVVEELLADPGVDVGVIGCVPFTGALDTLPAGPEHDEDLDGERSIVTRLTNLWERTTKPWIVVVDAGSQYDPLAQRLRAVGIPTFRTMDQAMTMLEMYGRWVAECKAVGGMGNDQG